MEEFLVGHFSFNSSIFLSLIKNWSATAMWIYYWGHYSPLTDNWMVHTTLFSLGATPSVVWPQCLRACVCVCEWVFLCEGEKRRWKQSEEEREDCVDRWFSWGLFFLFYYKLINHLLSSSFKPSPHPTPTLLSLSMVRYDGYVIETSCKAYIITFLVIIHNLFS